MTSTKSIMLIDDDSDDRMIFGKSLLRVNAGITFHEASNGLDGINKLLGLDKLPDYLFVDVNMPGMSGFEVLSKIRNSEKLKKLKVIIYTTSGQKSTIETAKKLGADGFLTKPEEIDILSNYITGLLHSTDHSSFIQLGLISILLSCSFLFHN